MLISTFKSGTKHTLTLHGLSLSPEVPHDSLPVKVDIIFQRDAKRRVAGSKLTTLTHQSADEQVECQMPRVYRKGGREFQVFVELWSDDERLTSSLDGYCHFIEVMSVTMNGEGNQTKAISDTEGLVRR